MLRFMVLGLFSVSLGCASSPKKVDVKTVETEANVELSDCHQKFGPNVDANVLSGSEYLCRYEAEDSGGAFTKLYNKWKIELWKAEKNKGGQERVAKIREKWRSSVRKQFGNTCAKEFLPNLIPVNGKIICESSKFSRVDSNPQ